MTVSQHNPRQPVRDPTGTAAGRANGGRGALLWRSIGVLALAAGLLSQASARAEESGLSAVEAGGQAPAAGQVSPLDEERAIKEAAIEATASDAPAPAPVPEPPENSADEEALIELPITPAGTGQGEADNTSEPADPASEGHHRPSVHADELDGLRVLFPADGAAIDAAAEADLLRLAGYLSDHQAQRIVLHAHAGDDDQGSSHARRLSLSRALAIRTFLVDQGVPADRIYLRPLGSQQEDGPPDRVDILPLRP